MSNWVVDVYEVLENRLPKYHKVEIKNLNLNIDNEPQSIKNLYATPEEIEEACYRKIKSKSER